MARNIDPRVPKYCFDTDKKPRMVKTEEHHDIGSHVIHGETLEQDGEETYSESEIEDALRAECEPYVLRAIANYQHNQHLVPEYSNSKQYEQYIYQRKMDLRSLKQALRHASKKRKRLKKQERKLR